MNTEKKPTKPTTHYQFRWWKSKPQPKVGYGKPPPGVRENVPIKKL